MRKLIRACSVVFILLCSLFYMAHAIASELKPTVTFIGKYTYQGRPALIIQFDRSIRQTGADKMLSEDKIAQVFSIRLAGGEKEATLQTGQWTFNTEHTAVIYEQVMINQRYRISLLPGIESDVGQEEEVTVHERVPQVNLVGRGPVVPSQGSRTVPLSVVNAEQLTVEVLKVSDEATLLDDIYYNTDARTWEMNRLRKSYRAVTTLSFDVPNATVNQTVRTSIQLPQTLSDGWYILLIKVTGDFDDSHQIIAHVLLTDIGIQAKVFPQHLSVLLDSLSGKTEITDARVAIYQKNNTIELGVMTQHQQSFDYQVKKGDVLVIQQGHQTSVLPLKEVPLDLSDFQVAGRDWQKTEAFVYSNRNLFKPGETLPLNIILRDQDGQSIDKQRLYVEYRKPDGHVVGYRWLEPSTQVPGFYQDQFSIPTSAPLGRWTAYIKSHQDAKRPLNQFSFNVSEFVPERMDMNIDIASGLQNKVESLPVRIEGKYLFGAPADGNQVSTSAFYQPRNHFEGKFNAFFVGEPFTIRSWKDVPEIDSFKLDHKGQHQFDLSLIQQQLLKSPVLARFNFELMETGGASIRRNKQLMLWTGAPLAGVRPVKDEVESYSTAQFDIGLLNGHGDQLKAGTIQYLLERNRGGYYWTYTESGGWDLKHDDNWQPVQFNSIHVPSGATSPLSVDVEWGRYRLTLKTEQKQVTRYSFWVGWGESGQLKPVKPDQLTMALDKQHYASGDNVVATINTDVAGRLHLSLESDQVEWHLEQAITQGKHQFTVPLKGLKRHDLYLSATLISPGQGNPRRLLAIKPVKLDRSARQLKAEIEHAPKLRPLAGADIVVRLAQPVKQSTWVTLSLVDKGIINLSRYKVPNMYRWFFDQRRYHGDVIDLYSRIYQQRPDSFLTHRYGGDAQASTNSHLDDTVESKTITLMSKPIAFNQQGEAVIHVDIPDYNGQAQIVAMVFNDHQYGQVTSDVDIASPVVAELAVPRFLNPGDTSQTLLELFNQTEAEQQITVKVSASELLSLHHPAEFTFSLAAGKHISRAVVFDIAAIQTQVEPATLNIDLSTSGADGSYFAQHRNWHIPVRVTQPVVTRQTLQTIPAFHPMQSAEMPSVTMTTQYWQGLQQEGRLHAGVIYSKTPQIGIRDYADHLFGYPYGCAEQTSSKAMPWLLTDEALEPLKTKIAEGKPPRDILKAAVMRLATMQKANGSFSMWDKYGAEQPWISVYATDFLWRTDQRYPGLVPEHMLEKALKNVIRYPQKSELSSTRYYAAWVGTKARKINYTTLWALDKSAHKKPLRSPLSAAYLGAALLLNGAQEQGEFYLKQVESIQRKSSDDASDNYAGHNYADYDYGSLLRDYAQTVVVLSTLEHSIKLSDDLVTLRNRLASQLTRMVSAHSYLSTQEQVSLVEAGIALKALNQDPVDIVLNHNRAQETLNAKGVGRVGVAPNDSLANPNPHPLFIQVMSSGLADPTTLQSTVPFHTAIRKYRRSNGQPYHGEPLKMGEKLIVTVSYRLKNRIRDALVVEYLPTGFVLENPDLTNSQDLIRQAGLKASSSTQRLEYRHDRLIVALTMAAGETYRFSYVIRAETPGQSSIPFLYVEAMYHPERFIYTPASLKQFTIQGIE